MDNNTIVVLVLAVLALGGLLARYYFVKEDKDDDVVGPTPSPTPIPSVDAEKTVVINAVNADDKTLSLTMTPNGEFKLTPFNNGQLAGDVQWHEGSLDASEYYYTLYFFDTNHTVVEHPHLDKKIELSRGATFKIVRKRNEAIQQDITLNAKLAVYKKGDALAKFNVLIEMISINNDVWT